MQTQQLMEWAEYFAELAGYSTDDPSLRAELMEAAQSSAHLALQPLCQQCQRNIVENSSEYCYHCNLSMDWECARNVYKTLYGVNPPPSLNPRHFLATYDREQLAGSHS